MNLNLQPEATNLLGEAVPAGTMGNRVFDALRQAIVQFQLRPGDRLSEADVAKRLGVSRQPVREAFIKLAEADLVEVRPQRGTLVRLISRRGVENARFLREAIELAIVRKAAVEHDAEGLSAIAETLHLQREADERGDVGAFMRADDAFHHAIAKSVDCDHAWRVLEGLKVQMDRVRFLSMPMATPVETLIEQHQAVYDALERRSPAEAEELMKVHLSEILKSLPRIIEANPDMFTA